MKNLQTKILNALITNKLNPSILGERKWYNYFISIHELVWARNFVDGYLIHIFTDEYKSVHLSTYTLTYDLVNRKDILHVDYENKNFRNRNCSNSKTKRSSSKNIFIISVLN